MKKILLLLGFFALFSCSNDSGSDNQTNPPDPEPDRSTVVTLEPDYVVGGVKLNGEITHLGDGYSRRGFCWSLNLNPVIDDNYITTDGSGEGPFFATVGYYTLPLESTFNIRAFVDPLGSNQTIYGNNITIHTPKVYELTVAPVKDIESEIATFSGSILSNDPALHSTIAHKGFCISTSATPTLDNSILWESPNSTLGNFEFSVNNLSRNTTYYVRSFGYNTTTNVYYSTDVVTFKTSGYIGVSGGYVLYDKGSYSNGWRYLEIAPNDATYNGSNLMKWGCPTTSIMQTSTEVGTGLENTNRIIQYCSDANCAARVCSNYSINGVDDWFLPSKGELYLMMSSLNGLVNFGDNINQTHWSSSEYDAGTAHLVNTYYNFGPAFGISKNLGNLVRPMRRF